MKFRNKKGVIAEGAALAICAAGLLVAAIVLTPGHRVRKAMEKCELTDSHENCVVFVAKLKADGGLSGTKPDYIRDK